MKNALKPPKTLSLPAKRLWKQLQAEYAIVDAAGVDLLNDLAQFYDRREEARAIIRAEGATVKDRFGQVQAHPATRIERDSSAAMGRILKLLNFDLEPQHDRPGRPPGS